MSKSSYFCMSFRGFRNKIMFLFGSLQLGLCILANINHNNIIHTILQCGRWRYGVIKMFNALIVILSHLKKKRRFLTPDDGVRLFILFLIPLLVSHCSFEEVYLFIFLIVVVMRESTRVWVRILHIQMAIYCTHAETGSLIKGKKNVDTNYTAWRSACP